MWSPIAGLTFRFKQSEFMLYVYAGRLTVYRCGSFGTCPRLGE